MHRIPEPEWFLALEHLDRVLRPWDLVLPSEKQVACCAALQAHQRPKHKPVGRACRERPTRTRPSFAIYYAFSFEIPLEFGPGIDWVKPARHLGPIDRRFNLDTTQAIDLQSAPHVLIAMFGRADYESLIKPIQVANAAIFKKR